MRWNGVLVMGLALCGLATAALALPEPKGQAIWIGFLAIGVLIVCMGIWTGPKRLYVTRRVGRLFGRGATDAKKPARFGRRDYTPRPKQAVPEFRDVAMLTSETREARAQAKFLTQSRANRPLKLLGFTDE